MLTEDLFMKRLIFLLVLLLVSFTANVTVSAQKSTGERELVVKEGYGQENPTPPVVVSNSFTCSDLNANPSYPQITTNWQLAYNGTPTLGQITHGFFTGGGWVLSGGALADPLNTMTLLGSSSDNSGLVDLVSWQGTRHILAAIVKGRGPLANAFIYQSPGVFADSSKGAPGGGQITQVIFCFRPLPSAAEVSLSGRVVSAEGFGIAKARLTILNTSSGETFSIPTNAFGFYKFEGLEVGNYILTIEHKFFRFSESVKFIQASDTLAEVNFTADP